MSGRSAVKALGRPFQLDVPRWPARKQQTIRATHPSALALVGSMLAAVAVAACRRRSLSSQGDYFSDVETTGHWKSSFWRCEAGLLMTSLCIGKYYF